MSSIDVTVKILLLRFMFLLSVPNSWKFLFKIERSIHSWRPAPSLLSQKSISLIPSARWLHWERRSNRVPEQSHCQPTTHDRSAQREDQGTGKPGHQRRHGFRWYGRV